MAPFSRVYELSENVVPAQGAEAIADTPGSVAPTTTSDKERRTDETDVTSLDSNKFNENDTRTPENRVDVTTLSHRRQQAKRSVPIPRLSANAFSSVLHRIDKVSSANPQADFDRAVVAGVQDYCYRTNQNTLNILAAVVPTLVNSGNFDATDSQALRNLFAQVQRMRHQADGSMGGDGAVGDGTGGDGGLDPSAPGAGLPGPGSGMDSSMGQPSMGGGGEDGMPPGMGDPSGGLSGPGGASGTAGQDPTMGPAAPAPGSGGAPPGQGPGGGDPNSMLGQDGGSLSGGIGGMGGGLLQGIGDLMNGGGQSQQMGDAMTAPPTATGNGGISGPAPGGSMLTTNRHRASRLAKLIMSGTLEFSQLSREAQNEVRAWVTAADDDPDGGGDTSGDPTTDAKPGSNENDQDNRQNPHGDGANSDTMVGDAPEYAGGGGGGTPDVDPQWKGSTRRRRRLADTNQEVAEKDTNRIDVQAPNTDTSDRAQQSQYDRGEYDQNGPLLNDPDKSTDQNWPPKASSVDAMRLADLYVAMNMVPAEKKYEIVAGFEKMNSWIVKDRLKVLGYVQKIAQQNAPQRPASSGRNRSMVPQSSGQQQTRGGMPSMGRGASLNGHRSDNIDTHFLAL